MAVQGKKNMRSVSVGAGATVNVCPAGEGRLSVVFFNNTAQVVALGKAGVTNTAGATGGIPLAQNQPFAAADSDDWFGNNPRAGAGAWGSLESAQGAVC